MGDVTEEIEKEINCNKVDVLKVGHHGSDTSSSSQFCTHFNIFKQKQISEICILSQSVTQFK